MYKSLNPATGGLLFPQSGIPNGSWISVSNNAGFCISNTNHLSQPVLQLKLLSVLVNAVQRLINYFALSILSRVRCFRGQFGAETNRVRPNLQALAVLSFEPVTFCCLVQQTLYYKVHSVGTGTFGLCVSGLFRSIMRTNREN